MYKHQNQPQVKKKTLLLQTKKVDFLKKKSSKCSEMLSNLPIKIEKPKKKLTPKTHLKVISTQ